MHRVHRYHDISAGHRVVGHESKCRHLHGHNYRIHFICEADPVLVSKEIGPSAKKRELDELGRVIDFGVIKERLCMWVEMNWDHKFLVYMQDPLVRALVRDANNSPTMALEDMRMFDQSLVWLPFNPTAENLAEYLVEQIGPAQLNGTGVRLVEVRIEETAKCHVTYGAK